MTIDEAIRTFYDSAFQNQECEESFQFNMQIAKWLEELKTCRMFRVNKDIKNPLANISGYACHHCDHKDEYIVELETENEELKHLLKLAVEDIDGLFCAGLKEFNKHDGLDAPEHCKFCRCYTENGCGGDAICEWRYAGEVKGLIENGNELDTMQ